MSLTDTFLSLTKQLYPTGRAFRMFFGSDFEKLSKGLIASEQRAWLDATSILNSALPDNTSFTVDDATDWERRLGLITNPLVSLVDRMAAIQRKMNHPGSIKARQHYLYIQGQLQAAGFNVYVFENIFPDGSGGYITKDPLIVDGGAGVTSFEYGDREYGDFQLGGYYGNIIANHIEESLDTIFDVGTNLRSTFFIGAGYLGTFASVDKNRKDEFRQLILKLKPVQEIGYLFVNYV